MRSLKYPLIVAVLVAAGALWQSADAAQGGPPQFPTITVDELQATMASVFLVDARTPAEFVQGHIPGAINVPPDKTVYISGLLPQNKAYPLVFYCRGVT